jgi:Holliday junction resolvasome RuvABC DNA-binding subunit
VPPAGRPGAVDASRATLVTARGDVREALLSLGYQPDEVLAAVRDLPDDGDSASLLKEALQRLAGGARTGA